MNGGLIPDGPKRRRHGQGSLQPKARLVHRQQGAGARSAVEGALARTLGVAKVAMDVRKQMEAIHSMARNCLMHWLKWFSITLAAVLLTVGLYTRQPPYFMFLILPLLIAVSAHCTRPHIRTASDAIRSGCQSSGVVKIEVDSSSDSERFYATVATEPSRTWRFEFIPLGWKPFEGQTQATLYTLPGLEWPALIEVEDGVLYPRYKPKPVPSEGDA